MSSKRKVTTLVLALTALSAVLTACAKYPVVVNASAPPAAAATSSPAR